MRIEPDASRSEAVRRAIEAYVRRKQIDAFKRLAGSRLVDLDWREMRQQSIDHALELEGRWKRGHAGKRSRPR